MDNLMPLPMKGYGKVATLGRKRRELDRTV